MTIIFGTDGHLRFIYDDATKRLVDDFTTNAVIRRASNVEPTHDGQWEADMALAGGPVLGPYEDRGDALSEERAWLNLNNIPVPKEA